MWDCTPYPSDDYEGTMKLNFISAFKTTWNIDNLEVYQFAPGHTVEWNFDDKLMNRVENKIFLMLVPELTGVAQIVFSNEGIKTTTYSGITQKIYLCNKETYVKFVKSHQNTNVVNAELRGIAVQNVRKMIGIAINMNVM